MSQTEFDRLVQTIDSLSRKQMRELREEIDRRIARSEGASEGPLAADQLAEQELQSRLFEAGLLSEIKSPRRVAVGAVRFTPITIEGEPLSETIVRERR